MGGVNFDRVASEYDETRGGVERAGAAAADMAGHLPAGDVLELGVGTGIVAEAVRREVTQVRRLAGVDISAQMLQRARTRLPGRLLRASALHLPFPDSSFDGVYAVHVLHLVPDVQRTLAEAARVLRPGGRVVAVHGEPKESEDAEVDLAEATGGLRALWTRRHDAPDEVRDAAAAVGLRVISQGESSPRSTRHTPAELAHLIRRRAWSNLWDLDDQQWRAHVQPVLAALAALPDQDRPRVQRARTTVTVLTR